MKRIVIAAALVALAGVSTATATASSASVCQPDGTGCTQAGTYPGPNAVINSDYGSGFRVVWTESIVQPYSSGVPLYWTAYVTYTNFSTSTLTLACPSPGSPTISEHMSGGSGDDGTVYAESSKCTEDPGLTVTVPPGGSDMDYATFHNVPWPGSAVAITWGEIGTSPYVYPFGSSPPTPPSPSGKACVFNAPKGGLTGAPIDGELISGHVGWAYLADPATGIWEYGANEGPIALTLNPEHFNDYSKTWYTKGTWADVLKTFKGAWPSSGAHEGYYHPGRYYKTYRCAATTAIHAAAALSIAQAQSDEVYEIPDYDCLSQTVEVLATYGAPISEHAYLLNPKAWAPNYYYESGYMSKFGPEHNV